MLRHIFKLFWNQRNVYGGMYAEQMVVFIVLLFCFLLVGEKSRQYFTVGMLNTENIYECSYYTLPEGSSLSIKELDEKMKVVYEKVRHDPSVVTSGRSVVLTPYIRPEEINPWDSVQIDDKKVKVRVKAGDQDVFNVFEPQLDEGEWLTDSRLEDGTYPAVITRQLKEQMGWKQGVGKKIYSRGFTFSVVGVISGIKEEPLKPSPPTLIFPVDIDFNLWWGGYGDEKDYLFRIREGNVDDFRDLINREFYKLMGNDNVELAITDIESGKLGQMQDEFLTLTGVVIPSVFLFVFAFIGTFGLFWLYLSKRKKEFALRIVVGSTPAGLKRFVILEGVLLTALAWIPGLIIFFGVYPINKINLIALGAACVVMIVFSVFSSWYPAYQVAEVNPVEAMREE